MNIFSKISSEQLRRIIEIKERIEILQGELSAILDSENPSIPVSPGRRRMSPAAKARIAAAQRARWARVRSDKGGPTKPSPKKRRSMSAAGRAKIAAAARARWAKAKAAGKNSL